MYTIHAIKRGNIIRQKEKHSIFKKKMHLIIL